MRWPAASPNERWLQPVDDLVDDAIACYRERAWAWAFVASSDDPERAFENWMERDVRFAAWVTAETDALGLGRFTIDGGRTADEVADAVAARFGWAGG